MVTANIALNRFGYGMRRSESAPGDPRQYLTAQMDAFDPTPPALAGREDASQKPGEILQMLRGLRRQRQMQGGMATIADMPDMRGQGADDMNGMAGPGMEREGTDPPNGLPPEIRQSYANAGRFLRADIGLRTNLAVTSSTPMMERLVHFWSNHFSVTAQKPGTHYLVADHEFRVIRPHVLGRFSDMLKAATLHPAMLLYLDQFQSIGPGSIFMQRRRRRRDGGGGGGPQGLNENLAREIMELHTLGVDGGYSQADVTEFARALTGWTVSGIAAVERFSEPQDSGAAFVRIAHEPGSRQVLGRRYSDNGPGQAQAILDDLASHPATARFIATKLARHFAGDAPASDLVARLEADFLRSGGDLASLTRTLIDAPEVWVESPVKFRQPFEWLVSCLRLTGIEALDATRLSGALNELGQVPWRAPSPAGYDDLEASWAGPDALFRRVELAERIAQRAPANRVMERAQAAFPNALSGNTRTWLSRAESNSQALGLLLVAPEMMRR